MGEGPQRRAGCPEQGKEPRVIKCEDLAPGRAGPVSLGDTAAEHRRRRRAGASLGPGRHGKATKAFLTMAADDTAGSSSAVLSLKTTDTV